MRKTNVGLILAAVSIFGLTSRAIAQETPAAPVTAVQQAPLSIDINAPPPAAPAATPGNDWMTYKNPYVGEQNNLSNPNRTKEEVTAWVEKVVMDALTFSQEDVNAKITTAKNSFVQQGWQEYATYIKESKLLDKVRGEQLAVRTIANGDSTILGAESIDGTFHWIVETPLLITFTKKDLITQQENTVSTGNFKSTIMVSRVNTASKEDGVAIKGWHIDNARR